MSHSLSEFAVLAAHARAGDQAALTDLIRCYEPEIRIAARVLLGPALRPYLDSLDIVQSVHGEILDGLTRGRFHLSSPDRLLALTTALVRYKIARHWRRLRRQQRLSGDAGLGDPGALEHLLLARRRSEDDPARAAQIRDQVRHLLARLHPIDRGLIELRLQGFSTAEAARYHRVDGDSLRVRHSRLRHRLEASGVRTDWF